MEYLDIIDENKKVTGEKILRTKEKPILGDNRFINIILIFIQNSEGKFLIQKTSKEKGSIMATTGGYVKSGNTSIETVKIEVEEELGLKIDVSDFKLFKSYMKSPVYLDVYYMKKDINIKDISVQKEEVEFVEWLTIEEILELIKKNEFRKSNIDVFLDLIDTLKMEG